MGKLQFTPNPKAQAQPPPLSLDLNYHQTTAINAVWLKIRKIESKVGMEVQITDVIPVRITYLLLIMYI